MTHDPKVGDIWETKAGIDRDGFHLFSDEFEITLLVLKMVDTPDRGTGVVLGQVIKCKGDKFRVNEKIVVDLNANLKFDFPVWKWVSSVD